MERVRERISPPSDPGDDETDGIWGGEAGDATRGHGGREELRESMNQSEHRFAGTDPAERELVGPG